MKSEEKGFHQIFPARNHLPGVTRIDPVEKAVKMMHAENDDIRYVSAEGLTSNDDHLHFNTESLREFGKRYFAAFAADTPELAKGTDAARSAASDDEKLAEMKAKKERGEISDKEYDAFVHAYIAKL